MYYQYRATILRVVDGDTLDVSIDLGFNIFHKLRIRLKGVDCPELRTEEGKAAKAFVETWLEGLPVTIVTYKDEQEKYGRYLAKVLTAKGDLVNDLIAAGHVKKNA